ncbi:MerR family transcriptional regulator [Metaclostridioides mangenotii]|uniref:MerR family transcriptional regulator n=1 Tax=Metaclostridioides mangenotii TaxID=1540 RepID=UPI0028E39778|nr:MerR family transcriptional regulator [Clostridioides mangenotii]
MKEYYKIGEISKIYNIGRDSLMYYEEIGILKPLRDTNGYRMYSLSDIWKLNMIKEFRLLDFPMKRVKEYLDDRTIDSTKRILNEELGLIDQKLDELIKHKKNIKKRLVSIENALGNVVTENVEVKYIKNRKAFILNADIKKDEDFDILIQKLRKEHEGKFDIIGNNNLGAIFSDGSIANNIYNEFKSAICFLEDREDAYDIVFEEGYYATLNYTGSYTNNKECIDKIYKFVKDNDCKIIGSAIEIYKIDIHETGEEEEFITEIQVPVQKLL